MHVLLYPYFSGAPCAKCILSKAALQSVQREVLLMDDPTWRPWMMALTKTKPSKTWTAVHLSCLYCFSRSWRRSKGRRGLVSEGYSGLITIACFLIKKTKLRTRRAGVGIGVGADRQTDRQRERESGMSRELPSLSRVQELPVEFYSAVSPVWKLNPKASPTARAAWHTISARSLRTALELSLKEAKG